LGQCPCHGTSSQPLPADRGRWRGGRPAGQRLAHGKGYPSVSHRRPSPTELPGPAQGFSQPARAPPPRFESELADSGAHAGLGSTPLRPLSKPPATGCPAPHRHRPCPQHHVGPGRCGIMSARRSRSSSPPPHRLGDHRLLSSEAEPRRLTASAECTAGTRHHMVLAGWAPTTVRPQQTPLGTVAPPFEPPTEVPSATPIRVGGRRTQSQPARRSPPRRPSSPAPVARSQPSLGRPCQGCRPRSAILARSVAGSTFDTSSRPGQPDTAVRPSNNPPFHTSSVSSPNAQLIATPGIHDSFRTALWFSLHRTPLSVGLPCPLPTTADALNSSYTPNSWRPGMGPR